MIFLIVSQVFAPKSLLAFVREGSISSIASIKRVNIKGDDAAMKTAAIPLRTPVIDEGIMVFLLVSEVCAPNSLRAFVREGSVSSVAFIIGSIIKGSSIYVATNNNLKFVDNIC